MGWHEVRADERVTEWERDDGHATIRLRRRSDGSCPVRLDRLHQAPDGAFYRRETVDSGEAAGALVERWQSEYDSEE